MLFDAGQDKARAYYCLLHKLGYKTTGKHQQFTYIVYMDDIEHLLAVMRAAYQNNQQVHLTTVHFTKYDKEDNLPTDPTMANTLKAQASRQYKNILKTLRQNLPKANLPSVQ